jgi:hypothetical protein
MLILHDLCHLQLGTLKLGLTPTWKCPLIYLRPAAIFYYLCNIRHIRKLKRTYYIVVLFFSCSSHTDDVSWELAQPRASFKNLSVGGHQEKGDPTKRWQGRRFWGRSEKKFYDLCPAPRRQHFWEYFFGSWSKCYRKSWSITIYNL